MTHRAERISIEPAARAVGIKKATVPVAEDDNLVLKVVTRILREGGYNAITARIMAELMAASLSPAAANGGRAALGIKPESACPGGGKGRSGAGTQVLLDRTVRVSDCGNLLPGGESGEPPRERRHHSAYLVSLA